MNFPLQLLRRNRGAVPREEILLFHFGYARHKPGHGWNVSDELPDFSTIRSDQSFNWSKYSIPIWVRFNDSKDYLKDYAVVGYKVSTIRQTKQVLLEYKYSNYQFEDLSMDIHHEPIETNYSHCSLSHDEHINKTMKRELRMTLRHNSKVFLKPNQNRSALLIICDFTKMIAIRITSNLITYLTDGRFSGIRKKQ